MVTDSLDCTTCLDPVSKTPGTTSYIIEIENENGCLAYDTITINVNVVRPVFAPNVFSPDDNGENDIFSLFGGPAVSAVQELRVFDRWGNQVYEGTNLPINDRVSGWDGLFNGKPMNPGVFTWMAKVLFIDGVVEAFTGDLTLVR